MSGLSPFLLTGLLDDAAIFPPGNAPLADAVAAHAAHRHRAYAAAVGPLVVRAADLAEVGTTEVAVVTGLDAAHVAVSAAGPRLRALEVALPAHATADEVRALASLGVDHAQGYHIGKPAPLALWLVEERLRAIVADYDAQPYCAALP